MLNYRCLNYVKEEHTYSSCKFRFFFIIYSQVNERAHESGSLLGFMKIAFEM